MQDEVREKSVAFVIRIGKTGGKLTASMLKYAIEQYLEQQRNPRTPHGKQSVKSLVKQGAGVQNIEITDKNIRLLSVSRPKVWDRLRTQKGYFQSAAALSCFL